MNTPFHETLHVTCLEIRDSLVLIEDVARAMRLIGNPDVAESMLDDISRICVKLDYLRDAYSQSLKLEVEEAKRNVIGPLKDALQDELPD